MSATISISSKELSRFNRSMNKYSKNVQKGVMKQVKVSAMNVQRYAVDSIRGSGLRDVRKSYKYDPNLARSIKTKSSRRGFGYAVFTNLFYAIFREEGTKRHPITAKNAPYLVFKIGTAWSLKGRKNSANTWVKTKSVDHPGTKAAPFMAPAAEKETPHFVKRILKVLDRA